MVLFFASLLFCVFGTVQERFYLSVKRRELSIAVSFLELLLTWAFLCTDSVIWRILLAITGILGAGSLAFFVYEGKTFEKAHNILIQAFVSSLFIFCSEQLAAPFEGWEEICVFCFSVFFQGGWCLFMYFMRLECFNALPFSEDTYKRTCYLIILGYVPLLVTACGVLDPYIKENYVFGILALSFSVFLALALNTLVVAKNELVTSNKLEVFVVQQSLVRQYIDNLQSVHQQIRILNHDHKHYLATMANFLEAGEYERAKDYLKSQQEQNRSYSSRFIFCDDNLINAILTDAFSKSADQGIRFDTEIRLGDKIYIDDVALSVLLLNSLSNAIESFQGPGQNDDKWIFLQLYTANDHMVLDIKNSIEKEIYIVNNKIASTKPKGGTEHGLGLESIRSIVESYSGRLRITAENHIFELQAILVNEPE